MVDKGAATCTSPPARRRGSASTASSCRSKTEPLTPVDTKQLCYSVLTDEQKLRFEEDHELDFSFGIRSLARFRANVYMQQACVAGAFRVDPVQDHPARGARPAAGRHRAVRQAARPRARHRADRLGQVDDARVDDRQDQHAEQRSHHHRRGSDRVPAPAQDVRSSTSARSAATPTSFKRALKYILRQDPDVVLDRRDARPRDDRGGADHRRDRPPRVRARCTRTARSRASTASSTCSRRTSRRRSARCCRSCSRA